MTRVLERTADHIDSGHELGPPGKASARTLGATLLALCVVALCLLTPVPSHAQSNRAQPDGAQSIAAQANRAPPNPTRSDPIEGAWRSNASAAQLYRNAQDDIGAGRLDAAVGSLEALIEQHPYTSLAKRARTKLRVLYAKQRRSGSAVPSPRRASPRRTKPLKGRTLRITVRRAKPVRRAKSKPTYNDAFKLAVADRVFFGQDSVGLGSRARAVVAGHAKWLKAHPRLTIILNAHADENGTAAFNKSLSQRRAEAVRDLLLERGVGSQRIKIAAHGRAKPVSRCKTTGCAAQNRRVVADVVLGGGSAPTLETASAPAAVPAPVPARRKRY